MIGTTCRKSKLDLPSKILAPHGYSFSLIALVGRDHGQPFRIVHAPATQKYDVFVSGIAQADIENGGPVAKFRAGFRFLVVFENDQGRLMVVKFAGCRQSLVV